MNKYYFFIACLGALVLGLIVVSFRIAGSPLDQKLKVQDDAIISDFSSLNQLIQTSYSSRRVLPTSLADLNTTSNTDQYAKYEYNVTSASSYNLCATFATNTQTNTLPYINGSSLDSRHPKGHACITYTLPSYLLSVPITPMPPVVISTPASGTTGGVLTQDNFLTAACPGQVKNGMCVMVNCSYTYPHDLFVKGQAIESGVTFEDTCSGNQIYEHSCGSADNGATYGHRVENFNCPKGCLNGACIK